ncbi:MAG: hypothetical protein PHX18_06700 [Candidatus Gastranaerophilales bacterium]|nr:hypothetical protein [Candidatus Gastranaerophilales bacterium]
MQVTFNNNVSFSARKYPSDVYSEWFVERVKNMMDLPDDVFISTIKKFDGANSGRDIDYHNLKFDLLEEKENKKRIENNNSIITKENSVSREKNNLFLKNKFLTPIFCDPIQLAKENHNTLIPNSIMIEGENEKLNEELIEWTAKNSNCRFVEIDKDEDILETLEFYESMFQKTRERTLLHIKNFDTLLNPILSKPYVIAALKDILSSCSQDYHTTIIFSASNAAKLDSIALQPHRVQIIDANFVNGSDKKFDKMEDNYVDSCIDEIYLGFASEGQRTQYEIYRKKYDPDLEYEINKIKDNSITGMIG